MDAFEARAVTAAVEEVRDQGKSVAAIIFPQSGDIGVKCSDGTVQSFPRTITPHFGRTALYRHFDEDNALLYVGISRSVTARLAQHSQSPWDHLIRRIDVEHYETREEAEAAEKLAIKTEKPIHNVAHNS